MVEFNHGSLIVYASYSVIVLYSRDHKGLGMAHEKTSPKKHPYFSLTTMKQYWLGLGPNKPSDQPEMLSTKTEYFSD